MDFTLSKIAMHGVGAHSPGDLVHDRYEIVGVLGWGGNAVTYEVVKRSCHDCLNANYNFWRSCDCCMNSISLLKQVCLHEKTG